MNFSWKKGILYGLLLWVIMFALASVFVGFQAYDNVYGKTALIVLGGAVAAYFSWLAHAEQYSTSSAYALSWTALGMVLDWIVTMRFNPNIFLTKSLWVGYAVGFLVVLMGPMYLHKHTDLPTAHAV